MKIPRERFHLSSMNRENCMILENSLWASNIYILLSSYLSNCFQKLRIFESSFSNNRKKSYWIFINSFLINKIRIDIHLSRKVFRILDGVLLDESRPRLKAKFSKNQQEVIPRRRFVRKSPKQFSKSQLVKFGIESINRVTRVMVYQSIDWTIYS